MKAKRTLLKSIKDSYTKDKKEADKEELWTYYIIRPISFYITWIFIKFKISANFATLISTLVGLIGSFCFLFSTKYCIHILGAFLFNLWLVIDCVDGNIARFYSSCSKYGEFLDAVSGYLILTLLFFSVGLGEFKVTAKSLYIILGSIGSLSSIFPRLVYQKFYVYLGEYQNYKKILKTDNINSKKIINCGFSVFNNLLNPSGFLLPVLFLTTLFKYNNLFLYFYTPLYGFICIISIVRILIYAKKVLK